MTDWMKRTEQAERHLSQMEGASGRMARDAAAAEAVGLTRATLKSYRMAFGYVARLEAEDPTLADLVRRKHPTAVNALRRLEERQGRAALAPFRANPQMTTAAILALEAKTRSQAPGGASLSEPLDDCLARLARHGQPRSSAIEAGPGVITRLVLESLGLHGDCNLHNALEVVEPGSFLAELGAARRSWLLNATGRVSAPATVQQSFSMDLFHLSYAIWLAAPRYQNREHYRWNGRDIVLRALTAARFSVFSVLVLPDLAARDTVLGALVPLPDGATRVLAPDARLRIHAGAPDRRTAVESFDNWILPAAGGAVVLTTPQTVVLDLLGRTAAGQVAG